MSMVLISRYVGWVTNCVLTKTCDELQEAVPDHESSSNILNSLNDDCTIFESNILDACDLTTLASVSKRFNRIAYDTFTPIYRQSAKNDFDGIRSGIEWQLDKYFHHFGKFVTTINLRNNCIQNNTDILLGMIADSCDNIERLYCLNLPPKHASMGRMYSIVPLLKFLRTSWSQPNLHVLLGLRRRVEVLEFCADVLTLPEIYLPTLTELKMKNRHIDLDAQRRFQEINPQVTIRQLR